MLDGSDPKTKLKPLRLASQSFVGEAYVRPEIRLIADGIVDEDTVLASLVVLPSPLGEDENKTGAIKIRDWPVAIRKLMADPEAAPDPRIVIGRQDKTELPGVGRRTGLPPASDEALRKAWLDMLLLDADPQFRKASASRVSRGSGHELATLKAYNAGAMSRLCDRIVGSLTLFQTLRVMGKSWTDRGDSFREANPLSSLAMQSYIVRSVLTNGHSDVPISEVEEVERLISVASRDSDAGRILDGLVERVAWVGRKRPGSAPKSGFVTAAGAGIDTDELIGAETSTQTQAVSDQIEKDSKHVGRDVEINANMLAAITEVIKADLPSSDQGQDGEEFAIQEKSTEVKETLDRISGALRGSQAGLRSDGRVATHFIDTVSARYQISMLPELERFRASLDPSQNTAAFQSKSFSSTEEETDDVVRRIIGLLEYPDVARLFGMVVDIEIPRAVLMSALSPGSVASGQFQMKAGADRKTPVLSRWSLVRLGAGSFEPVSIVDDPAPKPPECVQIKEKLFEDGVVKLAASHFLMSLDPGQVYGGLKASSESDTLSLTYGEPIDKLPSGVPAPRSAGISLVDIDRDSRAALSKCLAEMDTDGTSTGNVPTPADFDAMRPLYLEDLVSGYRIDVAGNRSVKSSGPLGEFVWTDASRRSLDFPGVVKWFGHDAKDLADDNSIKRERMSGSARSPHREMDVEVIDKNKKPGEQNPERTLAIPFQIVATWEGWTLGAPSISQKSRIDADDLNLEVAISTKGMHASMMPQRFGGQYAMGARYVLENGSSISFDAAKAIYDAPAKWTGSNAVVTQSVHGVDESPAGRAQAVEDPLVARGLMPYQKGVSETFSYYRQEPVAAPLLLLQNHPTQRSGEVRTFKENLQDIIATRDKASELKWNNRKRWLLSDRAPFHTCLLHGSFDPFHNQLPGQSYSGLTTWPELKSRPQKPIKGVFKDADDLPARKTNEIFYADPMARILLVGFFKDGEPAPVAEYPTPVAINLYPWGRKWPNAMPVEIEVKPVERAGSVPHSRHRAGLRVVQLKTDARVVVELEPAEQIDVLSWCLPGSFEDFATLGGFERLLRLCEEWKASGTDMSFLGTNLMDQAEKLSAICAELNESGLREASALGSSVHKLTLHDNTTVKVFGPTCEQPIQGVCHATQFHAVHAVQKPLAAPNIARVWALREVPLEDERDEETGDPADDQERKRREDEAKEAWSKYLEKPGAPTSEADFDMRSEDQKPESQQVLIGGLVDMHRKSTSEVQVIATWKDCGPENPSVLDPGTGDYVPKPVDETRCLCDFTNLPFEVPVPDGDRLDMLRTPDGDLRFAVVDLKSTRSVRMSLTPIAKSRYAQRFDKKLSADRFIAEGETTELIVPSSRRPDPVSVCAPAPAIHFSGDALDLSNADEIEHAEIGITRRMTIRLDLGASWCSSGEGEQLGIIFMRDATTPRETPKPLVPEGETASNLGLCGSGEEYWTEWGRDPIFATGEVDKLLTADRSLNAHEVISTAVPLEVDDTGVVTKHANFDMALFDVHFHPRDRHYYVDIDIDPDGSFNPFLRLWLVRYQRHSICGLEASMPKEVMVNVPYTRRLVAEEKNGAIMLRYFGLCYSDMAEARDLANLDYNDKDARPSTAKPNSTPRLAVIVQRKTDAKVPRSGISLTTGQGGVLQEASLNGLEPRVSNKVGTWSFAVRQATVEERVDVPEVSIEDAHLEEGIILVLRETQAFLTEKRVNNDDGVEWYELGEVERPIASMRVELRLKKN